MRCLVVNAYQNQSKGNARFQEFLGILRPILLHYDKASKIIVRPYTDLGDLIYAPDMPDMKGGDRKAGLRQFDTIDFLFIDGDEDLLPWLPEAADLFALVRIAFQTGKCMFSTIQGTQTMCYVNALGGEMLNVVNGRGQRLEDIRATDTTDPMLRELFDSVDEDGGGDLDRDEIVAVVKLLYNKRGLSRSKKQVGASCWGSGSTAGICYCCQGMSVGCRSNLKWTKSWKSLTMGVGPLILTSLR